MKFSRLFAHYVKFRSAPAGSPRQEAAWRVVLFNVREEYCVHRLFACYRDVEVGSSEMVGTSAAYLEGVYDAMLRQGARVVPLKVVYSRRARAAREVLEERKAEREAWFREFEIVMDEWLKEEER